MLYISFKFRYLIRRSHFGIVHFGIMSRHLENSEGAIARHRPVGTRSLKNGGAKEVS